MGILAKQRRRAARTDIRRQGTEFAGIKTQKVRAPQIRSTTFIYPPGSRRTGKPE